MQNSSHYIINMKIIEAQKIQKRQFYQFNIFKQKNLGFLDCIRQFLEFWNNFFFLNKNLRTANF